MRLIKIGHRGAKGHVAENTIASIKKAIKLGVDIVEVDVRATLDNKVVLFHDTKVERMTNGRGRVEHKTLEELKRLKVDKKYRIPALREALRVVKGKAMMNIHMKHSGFEKQVVEDIKKEKMIKNVIVSSTNFKSIAKIKELNPRIKRGLIIRFTILKHRVPINNWFLAKKLKIYSFHLRTHLVSKKFVIAAEKRGYKVFSWTANSYKKIVKVKNIGVDGIISDYPDRIKEVIEW